MKIHDFLLARIAEDEHVANVALDITTEYTDYSTTIVEWAWVRFSSPIKTPRAQSSMFFNGAPWPEDVLEEVAAKRKIINEAIEYMPELEHGDNGTYAFTRVLILMAEVYSDHPDYQKLGRLSDG